MADILSLSRARKAKQRSDKEAHAEANRLKFGRTKAEKAQDRAERALTEKSIDGHRRDK